MEIIRKFVSAESLISGTFTEIIYLQYKLKDLQDFLQIVTYVSLFFVPYILTRVTSFGNCMTVRCYFKVLHETRYKGIAKGKALLGRY